MISRPELDSVKEHVAILGFAEPCGPYNQVAAYSAGATLAKKGYIVTAGNLTSTFNSAFRGAKEFEGKTLAVLEDHIELNNSTHCDVVISVKDTEEKHRMIAELCAGAIIIGGGNGTKHLESEFLKRNKPVVALVGTGGITRTELDEKTKSAKTIPDTLTLIH